MRISVRPGPVRLAALGYRLCLLMMAASLTFSRAQAQALTGTIAGRVVDSAGAAVPSAQITVRDTDVASTRTLTSGSDGAFRVTGLGSGAYTVEGRAGGLASRRPVRLTVMLGSNTEIVLRLDVATVKQNTTVNARGATVEGNTVAPRRIQPRRQWVVFCPASP